MVDEVEIEEVTAKEIVACDFCGTIPESGKTMLIRSPEVEDGGSEDRKSVCNLCIGDFVKEVKNFDKQSKVIPSSALIPATR